MKLQRSVSGLVVVFVLAGGCAAASTAGISRRATVAPRAHIVTPASAASSAGATPSGTTPELNEPNVALRLSSHFVAAPGFLRSAIRVKRHPDNRVLRVVVDSANYFRSSAIELEGAHAARTHFLTWSSLPEGVYTLVATVYGSTGERSQQSATFEVRAVGGPTR